MRVRVPPSAPSDNTALTSFWIPTLSPSFFGLGGNKWNPLEGIKGVLLRAPSPCSLSPKRQFTIGMRYVDSKDKLSAPAISPLPVMYPYNDILFSKKYL